VQIPDWADERLSYDLPILRSRGEGQELEYMEAFPTNTRELAKEIAAFATTNTGTILIGVSDSGDLIGLPSCDTPERRDEIIRRLEGISRGTVKPAVTPTAKFALEDKSVVLVLTVPKGSQPVYYASNVPYVRHMTEARPADPHEVIEHIANYIGRTSTRPSDSIQDDKSAFYSSIVRTLVEVLVFADQASERQFNPWLDMWRSAFSYAASELRELAASQTAVDEGIETDLREIAMSLDHVASLRLYMGSGGKLESATEDVAKQARNFMDRHIAELPLNVDSLRQIRTLIVTTSRKLSELVARAETMIQSARVEELQSEASELGHALVRLSYYNIERLGEGIREQLKDVGRTLHLTETMRLYMDGGMSVQAIVNRIDSCSKTLSSIAQSLDK
jgi:ATP-dependent DNA helicase RecG